MLVAYTWAMKQCSITGCDVRHDAKGYCATHYQRWRQYGDPLKTIRKPRGECGMAGCERPHAALGWCQVHYYRVRRTGSPGAVEIVSPDRVSGRYVNARDGYVRVKTTGHPRATKNGWVREHILVMEEMLGRPVVVGEEVHHKNGVKSDNRPENLELWVVKQPKGQRPEDLVEWAYEILRRYADGVERAALPGA